MKALVPIGDGDFPVLARDLHNALDIKRAFTHWWKSHSKGIGEKVDFEVYVVRDKNPKGGRPSMDPRLTIDAAKKIAMLTTTAKGDEVREYFLECERRAQGVVELPGSIAAHRQLLASYAGALEGWEKADAARLLAEEHRDLEHAGKLLAEGVAEERRPAQEWAEDVSAGEGLVETRVALIQASVPGSVRLTKAMWADLDGWFFTYNPGAKPRQRRWRSSWRALGLGEDVPSTVGKGRNRKQVITPKWTPKGVAHLREWLIERQRQATL